MMFSSFDLTFWQSVIKMMASSTVSLLSAKFLPFLFMITLRRLLDRHLRYMITPSHCIA
jgi:hypothetical protein